LHLTLLPGITYPRGCVQEYQCSYRDERLRHTHKGLVSELEVLVFSHTQLYQGMWHRAGSPPHLSHPSIRPSGVPATGLLYVGIVRTLSPVSVSSRPNPPWNSKTPHRAGMAQMGQAKLLKGPTSLALPPIAWFQIPQTCTATARPDQCLSTASHRRSYKNCDKSRILVDRSKARVDFRLWAAANPGLGTSTPMSSPGVLHNLFHCQSCQASPNLK